MLQLSECCNEISIYLGKSGFRKRRQQPVFKHNDTLLIMCVVTLWLCAYPPIEKVLLNL